MEQVFEPVTGNQKQNQNQRKLEAEMQTQALRDYTQATTHAIQDLLNLLNKVLTF